VCNLDINTIIFRPITKTDIPKLVDVFKTCGFETRNYFSPIPVFFSLIGAQWLYDTEEKQSFVAESSTHGIVAWAYLVHIDNYFNVLRGNIATFALAVADRFQRQGIGSRFVDYLEEIAKKDGATTLITGGGTDAEGMLIGLLRKKDYEEIFVLNRTQIVLGREL